MLGVYTVLLTPGGVDMGLVMGVYVGDDEVITSWGEGK